MGANWEFLKLGNFLWVAQLACATARIYTDVCLEVNLLFPRQALGMGMANPRIWTLDRVLFKCELVAPWPHQLPRLRRSVWAWAGGWCRSQKKLQPLSTSPWKTGPRTLAHLFACPDSAFAGSWTWPSVFLVFPHSPNSGDGDEGNQELVQWNIMQLLQAQYSGSNVIAHEECHPYYLVAFKASWDSLAAKEELLLFKQGWIFLKKENIVPRLPALPSPLFRDI